MKPVGTLVAKIDRIALSERFREITGVTLEEADKSVNGMLLTISTWMEGMLRTIPEGTRAEMSLETIGLIRIVFKRRDKWSKWRHKFNIPQKPELLCIELDPCQYFQNILRDANKDVRKAYLAKKNAAMDAYLITHPRTRYRPTQKQN